MSVDTAVTNTEFISSFISEVNKLKKQPDFIARTLSNTGTTRVPKGNKTNHIKRNCCP